MVLCLLHAAVCRLRKGPVGPQGGGGERPRFYAMRPGHDCVMGSCHALKPPFRRPSETKKPRTGRGFLARAAPRGGAPGAGPRGGAGVVRRPFAATTRRR